MALTALGLANAITAAQGTAENPTIQADVNLKLATGIVGYLTANAVVTSTLPANSVDTVGSPTAQVGPQNPVSIGGTIS